MDHGTAFTIANLATSAIGAVKNAVDLSEKVGDRDLKHELSEIMTFMVKMQAASLELEAENRNLRSQLEMKGKLIYQGALGFYLLEGDENPYCAKCYDGGKQLVHLGPLHRSGSGAARDCPVCSARIWEERPTPQQYGVVHRGYDPYSGY